VVPAQITGELSLAQTGEGACPYIVLPTTND